MPALGVTRESFDRVRVGMTEAEAEAILGGPSGLYTDRPVVLVMEGTMFRRCWVGDEGIITIELDTDTPPLVGRKEFAPLPPESLAERFQRRLRRLVPRWGTP